MSHAQDLLRLAERCEAANIAPLLETAWREGWAAGYAAGREDGRWEGTYWCDEHDDWEKSNTARALAQGEG